MIVSASCGQGLQSPRQQYGPRLAECADHCSDRHDDDVHENAFWQCASVANGWRFACRSASGRSNGFHIFTKEPRRQLTTPIRHAPPIIGHAILSIAASARNIAGTRRMLQSPLESGSLVKCHLSTHRFTRAKLGSVSRPAARVCGGNLTVMINQSALAAQRLTRAGEQRRYRSKHFADSPVCALLSTRIRANG
ncbi:MAG: hypothetical protein QOK44_771 [Betaproteobacteria bacterium]|jgi:hypothetical protein|nr:hypothetical protein [Betaproteobacteria bacterium]